VRRKRFVESKMNYYFLKKKEIEIANISIEDKEGN
jgi:hypothetical protein